MRLRESLRGQGAKPRWDHLHTHASRGVASRRKLTGDFEIVIKLPSGKTTWLRVSHPPLDHVLKT